MGPIGRIIFERADGSGFYAHAWDTSSAAAMLPGGFLNYQQGGKAYTYQGATTPLAQADAPLVLAVDTRPALTALQASVAAIPTTTAPDYSAALATVQAGLAALAKAVQPDVTPAVTALAAAVSKLTSAAAAGPTTIALPNGSAGGVWTPFNTADPDPTVTIAGKTAVATALSTVGTAFAS